MGREGGFERVKGPVFAGSDREGRVNAGFVGTARGSLVVDTLVTREDGQALLAAAEAEAGPVAAIVFTHEHADHTIGSTDFPLCGIIASEGTARGMAAELVRSGQVWAPQGIAPKIATLVFESRIRLPWTPEVVVAELGGHAEGSTVVYLPESGVLFSGDLVFRGRAAWVGGMRPEKWLAALRTMEGWDVETVIPGHGPIGGRDILTEQRLWLERLLERAGQLRAAGTNVVEAVRILAGEFAFAERQLQSLRTALVKRLEFADDGKEA